MKSKTFFILVALFGVFLAVVFLVSRQDKTARQQSIMGNKLFDNLPANDIETIVINSVEGMVTLTKGRDFWGVENRFNYRADFSKITDLVKKIMKAKIGRSFRASKKVLSRLSMHPPEQPQIPKEGKGTNLVFKDKGEEVLADIIIGSDSSGTENFYIMHKNDPTIYLIDENFKFLDKNAIEWLDKTLIDLDSKDVAKVICYGPKSKQALYTITRPDKEKEPALIDVPAEKKITQYKIDQVVEVLSPLKIEDIVDPAKKLKDAAFPDGPRFEYYLFNGLVYSICPGAAREDGSDNHYFKVSVSYQPVTEKKETVKTDSRKKMVEEAERQNKKLSAWTYIISKWVYNSLVTSVEEFFEKEEKT